MKEEKSKSKLKIKIDPDQIIDTSNFIIPQNKLTCKICYCVLINPKICYNKKCGQICCNDCIESAMNNNQPCPFCKYQSEKMEYQSVPLSDNLVFILQNIKIVCKHINAKCSKKIFSIESYKNHLTETQNEVSKCSHNGHNEIEWNTLRTCAQCELISCRYCQNVLRLSNWVALCNTCIQSSSQMTITNKSTDVFKCTKCFKEIKNIEDPFSISKCDICHDVFCNKCTAMCSVCKRYICVKDILSCDNCRYKHPNSYICIECSKTCSLFRQCTKCNMRYCINCVNICNACSTLLCAKCDSENIIKCSSCEDIACAKHVYSCTKCNKKCVCLKKCTYTCEICFAKSTSLCDEKNHAIMSSTVMHCPHQICSSCIERCDNCGCEQCQLCNTKNSNMFVCDICNGRLCFKCANFCFGCYTTYCVMHKCIECDSHMDECFNCFIKDNKISCINCDRALNECEKCLKVLLCSNKCYESYIKKHLNEEDFHLCDMFYCKECRKKPSVMEKKNEEIVGRRKKKKEYAESENYDKVTINCEESCVCLIF